MSPSPATAAEAAAVHRLVELIVSCWRTQALHVAVRLGLPDALAPAPQPGPALAQALGCDADGLTRLLRALCSLGVCTEDPGTHRFTLTQAGRRLCREGGGAGPSLRALALWWGGPLWPVFGALEHSVRTGQSAHQQLTGQAGYSHLDQGDGSADLFHAAMQALTALVLDDLVRLPCWPRARHVVDVGGGHGPLALALLAAHPHLSACILDLPHAGPGARAQIAQAGLDRRCHFEAGSFFEALPCGADVYVLKSILHNWDDARCATLLARCREAAPAGATLLLVERIRPPALRPTARDEAVTRTDLNMLAGLGGRERSEAHYHQLLQAAGFVPDDTTDTGFEFSVIAAQA